MYNIEHLKYLLFRITIVPSPAPSSNNILHKYKLNNRESFFIRKEVQKIQVFLIHLLLSFLILFN